MPFFLSFLSYCGRESWPLYFNCILLCECVALFVYVQTYLPCGGMGSSVSCDCGIAWPCIITYFCANLL